MLPGCEIRSEKCPLDLVTRWLLLPWSGQCQKEKRARGGEDGKKVEAMSETELFKDI